MFTHLDLRHRVQGIFYCYWYGARLFSEAPRYLERLPLEFPVPTILPSQGLCCVDTNAQLTVSPWRLAIFDADSYSACPTTKWAGDGFVIVRT